MLEKTKQAVLILGVHIKRIFFFHVQKKVSHGILATAPHILVQKTWMNRMLVHTLKEVVGYILAKLWISKRV